MSDVTTLTVRGEGGSVFEMDLPPEGSPKREIFDDFVSKGWLTVVGPEAPTKRRDVKAEG